jgi:hypothetical protein
MLKSPPFWAAVVLLTALGSLVFPGHTYLQSDTQIYVPMMERIYNPVLFLDDPMMTRPHLALTAYDEIAIALRNYAGLDFEAGLKLQQLLFRACAAAGLLLIAMRLGLTLPGAFFVAAVVTLNSASLGIGITELDPIPRAFAFGLLLLAVGLSFEGEFLAAGIAAALGFLIHPTTMAPFWVVAAFAVWRRAARPILLAPLPVALIVFALLMHFQAGATESLDLFGRVDPFQEALQRQFMGINFISEWNAKQLLDGLCELAVMVAGFWRLRLAFPLRDWLGGFALLAVLSVPFSWIVLDQMHLTIAGPWVPLRAIVFISLLAAVFSAACGILAVQHKRWWEAPAWFAIALALPVKEFTISFFVNPRLMIAICALVAASIAGAFFASRTRGLSLAAAAMLPFFVYAAPSLVPPTPAQDTPELQQLAAWARANTDETAVFLFADEGRFGGSGPFRARALRTVYVDYEGRALVNYYAEFSAEWAKRWRDVHTGNWMVTPQDFPDLASRKITFVILRTEHSIPNRKPDFSNPRYLAYRVFSDL